MGSTQLEWKWSNGEKYERTMKIIKEDTVIDVKKEEETVINACLKDDIYELSSQDTNQVIDLTSATKGFIHKENKLNGQNEKLSSRHMIVQKGINPFVNTENYVDHLNTETSFLRPKDSNFSKE